jgi:molybdopterin biosynthesis enzyme
MEELYAAEAPQVPFPVVLIDETPRIMAAHAAPLSSEEIDNLTVDGRMLADDVFVGEILPDVPKAAEDSGAFATAV